MKVGAPNLVACLAVAAVLASPSPASAAPSPLRHDLGLVNGHLRIAIEYAPEELGESLRSAELICSLGERAAGDGEADLAAADWTALGQLVDQVATGAAQRVETAFRNAGSVLGDLRARYERRWAGAPTYLRELRRGVGGTRRGIKIVRRAVAGLTTPFARWREHQCEAASRGVERTFDRVPDGLEKINVGMLRLWRLAELPPPTEGR
ncbi:MAG: hypothetical protein JSS97_19975 [Actinobacteria bacterium]|nr:hypothetical protein [Actinomycetota bacterium]